MLGYLLHKASFYQMRYVECNFNELLSNLESAFPVTFPEDVSDVKAAKTRLIEGTIHFVVRFNAEPIAVDRFLDSFPRGSSFEIEQYKPATDPRKHRHLWPAPKWFTRPIQQGKTVYYHPGSREMDICVDITAQKSFLVYAKGRFLRKDYKPKP